MIDLVERGKKFKQEDIEDLVHYCNFYIYLMKTQCPEPLQDKKNMLYWMNKQLKKMKASWK